MLFLYTVLEKHVNMTYGASITLNVNVNATSGSVHVPIGANAMELTENFEVRSQIGSKKDTPHLHTAYVES